MRPYVLYHFGKTYRNILLDASARKDAMQFWSQFAFAEQREYHGVGEHGFQCLFAMRLTVYAQQNLCGAHTRKRKTTKKWREKTNSLKTRMFTNEFDDVSKWAKGDSNDAAAHNNRRFRVRWVYMGLAHIWVYDACVTYMIWYADVYYALLWALVVWCPCGRVSHISYCCTCPDRPANWRSTGNSTVRRCELKQKNKAKQIGNTFKRVALRKRRRPAQKITANSPDTL